MLMEWLKGKPSDDTATAAAAVSQGKLRQRKTLDVDVETPLEPSNEESIAQKEEEFRKKLAASAKDGPVKQGKLVSYESFFRNAQQLLLEGNASEIQEGLTVNVARNAQNTMLSSKCVLISPQMSHWEVGLQMNGFSDIVVATYNTLSRWGLMYQRVSSTGALLFAQCMAQRQQGMTQGTVVGVLQYPWVHGGCTHLQYVKDQSFTLSHAQRIIRGVHLGSNLLWDVATKKTTLSHAAYVTNPSKTNSLSAEWNPSKGDWKLALTRRDWAHDVEFAMQLEYTQKGHGMMSLLSFGMLKNFIGGGKMGAALAGFSKLKAVVELPFGGERRGLNQLHCMYNAQYDIHTGALKHGIVFTA